MSTNDKRKKEKGKKANEVVSQNPAQQLETRNSQLATRLPYLIIFIFTCLIYSNTLWNKYASDDAIVLTENIYTTQGIAGLKDIFTHDVFEGFFKEKKSLVAGGRYRPLSVATFAIEYEFFGLNPMLSHAGNVLLFAVSCMLIFYLFQLLIPQKKDTPFYISIPFLCAMLYAAHPIHTEAVANIKGRDEIMSMLFAIASLVLSVLFVKRESILYLVFAAFCFFLSLLSKENSITFIAVIPLTYYFFLNAKLKHYLIGVGSVLAPTVLYLLLRGNYAASSLAEESTEILNNPFVGASFAQRYATPVYSFLLYYIKLVFPHPLSHDYYFNQIPLIEFGDVKFITGAMITIALVGIALNQILRKTIVSFSILYYFITFSVVSNILFSVGIIMNERFQFMPSLGFCLLLATGFHYLFQTKRLKAPAAAFLAAVVLFLFSAKTFSRNYAWKDNLTLFLTDVKNSPNSAKVNTSAGGDLLAASDIEPDSIKRKAMIQESISYLTNAMRIYPDNFNALLLMGNAQFKYYKNTDAALPFYNRILELRKGGELLAYQNAGNLLYGEKQYAKALPYLNGLLAMQPDNIEVALRISDSYAQVSKIDSSRAYIDYALQKSPNNAMAIHQMGKLYGRYLNDLNTALPYLKKATELSPTEVTYLEDLGVAYGLSGQYDSVIETMNKILKINPNYVSAYRNISISYMQKGDKANADLYMQKAAQAEQRGR